MSKLPLLGWIKRTIKCLPKKAGTLNYFEQAKSWADDYYTLTLASRNRYRVAFYMAMALVAVLGFAIVGLTPLHQLTPLLIHHYDDGRVLVEPFHDGSIPNNEAQMESDLVRYVIHRESFDATTYRLRYATINLLSSEPVARDFIRHERASNPNSLIHQLGKRSYRSVHVENIIFLDNENELKNDKQQKMHHHNLAEVNFTITDHEKATGRTTAMAYTALLTWHYRGIPKAPEIRWRNWNGFTVTQYTVHQRNLHTQGDAQ